MANINLSDLSLYSLVQEQDQEQNQQPTNQSKTVQPSESNQNNQNNKSIEKPKPNTQAIDKIQSNIDIIKIKQRQMPIFKRSLGGFLLFVAIVVVLALFIYFTVYRLGWGVSECMKGNYHDCGALITPELAPVTLVGLSALL